MKWRSVLVKGSVAFALGLLCVTSPTGCRSPETSAPAGATAIRLTGNVVGSMLTLDDRLSFQITAAGGHLQFNVAPGKHRVRVEKDGVTVLDRTVSVTRGQTLELAVP